MDQDVKQLVALSPNILLDMLVSAHVYEIAQLLDLLPQFILEPLGFCE
jgi:hypothetical protein